MLDSQAVLPISVCFNCENLENLPTTMIEETGKVIAKEEATGKVWVNTMRAAACDSCAAKPGCGQSTLSKMLGPEANHVLALDPLGVEVGDEVVIGIPEDIVVKSSLLMYFLPLVSMLVAAVAMSQLETALGLPLDLLTVLGCILGFTAGLAVVKWHGHKNQNNEAYQVVVLREQIPLSHTPINIQ